MHGVLAAPPHDEGAGAFNAAAGQGLRERWQFSHRLHRSGPSPYKAPRETPAATLARADIES